jgi:hypothetical protein
MFFFRHFEQQYAKEHGEFVLFFSYKLMLAVVKSLLLIFSSRSSCDLEQGGNVRP